MSNWYSEMQDARSRISQTTTFTFGCKTAAASCEPLIKVAYDTREHQTDLARLDNSDGASCKVQLTETKNKVAVNVTYTTDIYAFPLMEETWLYPRSEIKRASKTYNRIVNVIEDLKTDAEDDEVPTTSIQGKVREELRFIDVDRKKPTNNASTKAARYEPGESDWRKSLYGTRYPQATVVINNTDGTIYLNNG